MSYMAFGGVLVFLGMLAALMSPLTAERDKFREIECTRLTVVDADGKTRVIISSSGEHGGSIGVYSKAYLTDLGAVALSITEHGGRVIVSGNKGGMLRHPPRVLITLTNTATALCPRGIRTVTAKVRGGCTHNESSHGGA